MLINPTAMLAEAVSGSHEKSLSAHAQPAIRILIGDADKNLT